MKTKSKMLLIPALGVALSSYAQTGAISGVVRTSDNEIASDLTIVLNDSLRTKANSAGEYGFRNLKPGIYALSTTHIGLQTKRDTIHLHDAEKRRFDLLLSVDKHMLQEVVVEGQASLVETITSPTLRVQTPLIELPQSVQIVNADLMARQQIFNMADGLMRNVSGVSRLSHWNDMYVNLNMRGSKIQAFRNGMNAVSSFWSPLSEDMSVVERVEIVKGPAGFMMSSGDPAGIYNVVTKKPTGVERGEVTFSMGSFSSYRSTVDLDGKLSKDKRLLYRLNIAGDTKGSFRPFEENKRLVIAPVLSYQLDNKTKATLEYTYQRAQMTDVGSGYVFSPVGYKALPRETTFSSPGLEPIKVNDQNIFLTLERNLNEQWKLTAQGAYFSYDQIGANSWPKDVLANGDVVRQTGIWDATSTMALGQVFVNGNLQTGAVKHRILGGLDFGRKDYYADWSQSFVLDSLNGGEFNPRDPQYGLDFPYTPFNRSTPLKIRAAAGGGIIQTHYSSAYLQDELGFFDNQLRLTLAARYTAMSQASWGGDPIESKKITPRVGLSYSIDRNTSAYALYDQSFIPQNGVLYTGEAVKPLTGDIMELGLKRAWFNNRLSTTVSAYQILKNNEVTAYGPRPNENIEIGQKRVRGIEVDIMGRIAPGFDVVANYAFTDAEITKVNAEVEGFYAGQRLSGADRHIANVWLDYHLQAGALSGLSFRAGMTTNVDRTTAFYSDDHPEWNLPDYLRFDAGLGYHKDNFTVIFNVQNLADSYLLAGGSYYDDYFSTPVYSWQAELPRNFRLTFGYKF
ncbi:TonB-dependent siderophore receptor [Sphingobacterium paludis]|nr:TonB-dependent siderophore receptor [Sphingobacterium paludis]